MTSQRDAFSYRSVSPTVSPTLSPHASPPSSPFFSKTEDPARQELRLSANAKRQKYLRRLLKFKQMDFEYAFWQMIYLFVAPQKVYRNFQYRKNTKDQWARDDPAFLVLLSFWLIISSIGFAVVLGLHFLGFLKFILWVVFVDCIGVGLLIATLFWFITNRYMVISPPRGQEIPKGQDVEWGYAFDVHLNAFFPLLMILHLFQLAFLHSVINQDWFVGRFFGNTLWLVAICYYIYITFLGYSALPFLKNTRALLFPVTGVIIVYVLSLILNWNFSWHMCTFYRFRVF
ncbi:protein unc-50 homolog A-like [Ruditapes philippinarum]|uniref:protein unc-50 homolog A-like n=1 Tax=Ruditapes philippinarum TaxID=129788 RepID=UPI00295A8068|nr:protein unc-50 homolog A-like [Ruditapes philippinarum]XP_060597455.1 protein unc-50 homolog A-like [Ruditapes philippinarum]